MGLCQNIHYVLTSIFSNGLEAETKMRRAAVLSLMHLPQNILYGVEFVNEGEDTLRFVTHNWSFNGCYRGMSKGYVRVFLL